MPLNKPTKNTSVMEYDGKQTDKINGTSFSLEKKNDVYIKKYNNGVMEQWGEISLEVTMNSPYGALFRPVANQNIVFPVAFIKRPEFFNMQSTDMTAIGTQIVYLGPKNSLWRPLNVENSSTTVRFTWKAIGLWKELSI